LGRRLSRWKNPGAKRTKAVVFRPADPDFDWPALVREHGETIDIPDGGYRLEPGTFHLGWTAEEIQLPPSARVAARVEGKSAMARLGVGVHVTAPTIHAGFGYKPRDPSYPGTSLQLEIWNFGPLTIELKSGMRICQLILEEVHGTPEKGYEGKFAFQGPDLPRSRRGRGG
jgi:dCTP deaminase